MIVAISLVDAIVALVSMGSQGTSSEDMSSASLAAFGTLKVLRVFRVSRVFRLLKSAKNLRRLLATLAYSIPDVLNTFGLTAIVIAVYAILGQQFFWNVKPGTEIDAEHAHFRNFGASFLLLIRSAFACCAPALRPLGSARFVTRCLAQDIVGRELELGHARLLDWPLQRMQWRSGYHRGFLRFLHNEGYTQSMVA